MHQPSSCCLEENRMNNKTPSPTGEYGVGTFTYTVYNDRDEVMEIGKGTKRSITARVYYPVLKESCVGCSKPVCLSENMIKGLKSAFKVAPNFKKDPTGNISEC